MTLFVEVLTRFCDDPRDLAQSRLAESKLRAELAQLQAGPNTRASPQSGRCCRCCPRQQSTSRAHLAGTALRASLHRIKHTWLGVSHAQKRCPPAPQLRAPSSHDLSRLMTVSPRLQAAQASALGQPHSNGGPPPHGPATARSWDAENQLAHLHTRIAGLEAKKAELEVWACSGPWGCLSRDPGLPIACAAWF